MAQENIDQTQQVLVPRNILHTHKPVKQKQLESKTYTDNKSEVEAPNFQLNDTVCIRRYVHVYKGSCKFTEPLTVIPRVGPSTDLLSDRQKWNASKLAHFPKASPGVHHREQGNGLWIV